MCPSILCFEGGCNTFAAKINQLEISMIQDKQRIMTFQLNVLELIAGCEKKEEGLT